LRKRKDYSLTDNTVSNTDGSDTDDWSDNWSVGEDGGNSDGYWLGNNDGGMGLDDSSGDSDSWSVLGCASVGHVLDNTVSVIRVGHSLDTTVGKVDSVGSRGGITVSLLGLLEGGSRVVIGNSVVESVCRGLREIISIGDWGLAVSGGNNDGSSWQSSSDTEESSSDESLHG